MSNAKLDYVLGGFGWVASRDANPSFTEVEFFLDDIQFELSEAAANLRLQERRLLQSFVTRPRQPDPARTDTGNYFDLALRNTAFIYDNALAVLAFLAEGSADGLRRARLIADAFIYAMQNDRAYPPDRLRSAYAAGDYRLPPGWTPRGRAGTPPVAGFYVEPGDPDPTRQGAIATAQVFYEVEQAHIDVGNNAWAAIALLAVWQRTGDSSYLDAAKTLGGFIRSFRATSGTFRGFRGGTQSDDTVSPPVLRPWASTEHNLDVHAAFTRLAEATGDATWTADAQHARTFVEQMWDTALTCYLAGTINGEQRNAATPPAYATLPLDVQAWSVLSLGGAAAARNADALACAQARHRNTQASFDGYDFNGDKDGVWLEGTGQIAVATAFAGLTLERDRTRGELRRAQNTAGFGDGGGIVATTKEDLANTALDGLTTGFQTQNGDPFLYFRRIHIGATAWNVFAQLGFNPYFQTRSGG